MGDGDTSCRLVFLLQDYHHRKTSTAVARNSTMRLVPVSLPAHAPARPPLPYSLPNQRPASPRTPPSRTGPRTSTSPRSARTSLRVGSQRFCCLPDTTGQLV